MRTPHEEGNRPNNTTPTRTILTMISRHHNCIFIHIPKTGGTSVENAIWGPDWSTRTTDDLWMGAVRPGFNKYQSGGLQHLLATQIRTEVGQDTFNSYYKFAFVRNPWDKAVSQFHYLKTQPAMRTYMGLGRWSSFKAYVRTIAEHHGKHVQSYEQWRFILDDDGTQLVDFVGRFENLADDYKTVAHHLQLDSDQLPHDMKSGKRKKPVAEYYDTKTVDLIAQIYARDIEHFGYEYRH